MHGALHAQGHGHKHVVALVSVERILSAKEGKLTSLY